MNKRNKKALIITSAVLGSLLVVSTASILYMGLATYKPDEVALSLLNDELIIKDEKNYLVKSSEPSNKCIYFYPGARVEVESYLPLAKQISTYNIDVYLLRMPLSFAFFGENKGKTALEKYSSYEEKYIMGHSLGGTVASSFTSKNKDKVDGLILLGSYPYKEYPLEKTLTIYGTLDDLATKNVKYDTNVVKIEGGNHCYFGNYGQQKGDNVATISRQYQQEVTSCAISSFINK